MGNGGTTWRVDAGAIQRRIRDLVAGLLVLLGFSAIAAAGGQHDDSVATLVARVAAITTPWVERCAAEDVLAAKAPGDVLPALLPHVGQGMPPGGIWNSGGREFDARAPAVWQAYYAVGRVWDAHIVKLPEAGGAAILREMLATAPTATAKVRVVLGGARWPELEPALAALLRDEKEPVDVRTAAAQALILYGKGDYHADLLAAFDQETVPANREAWFQRLVAPRHKARSGVDPRVVVRGFELVETSRAASPRYIHGAYFLVVAIGDYIDRDFAPPQRGSRYVTATGLAEAFFSDTVEHALRWWKAHRAEIHEVSEQHDITHSPTSTRRDPGIRARPQDRGDQTAAPAHRSGAGRGQGARRCASAHLVVPCGPLQPSIR